MSVKLGELATNFNMNQVEQIIIFRASTTKNHLCFLLMIGKKGYVNEGPLFKALCYINPNLTVFLGGSYFFLGHAIYEF